MLIKVLTEDGTGHDLGPSSFLASGGQAKVFVHAGEAFKIFADGGAVPDALKMRELARIHSPRVVVPQTVLFDPSSGDHVGVVVMPFVPDARALCELFVPAFQSKERLGVSALVRLAQAMGEAVAAVHAAGAAVVDLNDMDVLVARRFDDVRLIDADSYQTPSRPATALDSSVADVHIGAAGYGPHSDWFSLAVLLFQLFVGAIRTKGFIRRSRVWRHG